MDSAHRVQFLQKVLILLFFSLSVWTVGTIDCHCPCASHHTSLFPKVVGELTGTQDRSLANLETHKHNMAILSQFPVSFTQPYILPDHSSDEVMVCDVLPSPLIPFFLFFFFQSSGSRWNSIGMVEDAATKCEAWGVGCILLILSQMSKKICS